MTTAVDAPRSRSRDFPPFVPHPFVRGGHLQTIVGGVFNRPRETLPSVGHEIVVDDGDRLCVLDSVPDHWVEGAPLALIVHGLAGTSESPYAIRMASRLYRKSIRVVRMNLRGAGAGFGLARGMYHAGRSEDVRRVVEWMTSRSPGSPLAMIGFSLGANLVLKLAGESSDTPLIGLDCVLAANPPIDLLACSRHIARPANRIYDKSFVRLLKVEVGRLLAKFPDLTTVDLRKVQSLYDFDEAFTAPRNGFSSVEDYYERSRSGRFVPRIKIPGLVVHAKDDPLIPSELFREVKFPVQLALEMVESGGHLGYFSRPASDGDRHWLESRLSTWLLDRWGLDKP